MNIFIAKFSIIYKKFINYVLGYFIAVLRFVGLYWWTPRSNISCFYSTSIRKHPIMKDHRMLRKLEELLMRKKQRG